jgi:tetratricopeptide (TPR) repeat protein
MSFNNFLSTSEVREVSLVFAESASGKNDTVGILFEMTIDPLVSSAPFAAIGEVSYYNTEEEILFSMHTVFRIGKITKLDENNPLYQVELKLTADDDEQLHTLTKHIREETSDATGWRRSGQLLLKLNQVDKAEELYQILLEQTSDEREKALSYHQLGYVKDRQGDYEKAIGYYEQGLAIERKTLPPNHPALATSYINIGSVYDNMAEYSKALSFNEKALEIKQKTLPANHPGLATSYINIGSVYDNMGEYSKALSFYEKTKEIFEKFFLQIILRWLLPTTASVCCIATWDSTRKHFRFTKNHLKFKKKLFLQIILIWLFLTVILADCPTRWEKTRKHFRFTKNQLKFDKKLFL